MKPVPAELDGATVIAVAELAESHPTGGTLHLIDGEVLVTPSALAIAAYVGEARVYLFYCDETWTVVTDTMHDSVESAVEQARSEFLNVTFLQA